MCFIIQVFLLDVSYSGEGMFGTLFKKDLKVITTNCQRVQISITKPILGRIE